MLCSGHRCGHDLHCGGGQEDRLQDKEQEAVEGGRGRSVSSSQVISLPLRACKKTKTKESYGSFKGFL